MPPGDRRGAQCSGPGWVSDPERGRHALGAVPARQYYTPAHVGRPERPCGVRDAPAVDVRRTNETETEHSDRGGRAEAPTTRSLTGSCLTDYRECPFILPIRFT